MVGGLRLRIYEANRPVFADEFSGPVELGRQEKGEKGPFTRTEVPGTPGGGCLDWSLPVTRKIRSHATMLSWSRLRDRPCESGI